MKRVLVRVRFALFALFALFVVSFVGGCEDEPPPPPPKPAFPTPPPGGHGGPAPEASAAPTAAPTAPGPELPQREFTEADFSETDKNRDPFRNFAAVFAQQAKGRSTVQRQVVIERYAVDELKLSGIVTRSAPRALFIDPASVGWVVKVGDYVGKPEIVRSGGPSGVDIAINWRVDRIRDGDVVFVREDPAHPEIAPVTRVIALFPTESEATGGRR